MSGRHLHIVGGLLLALMSAALLAAGGDLGQAEKQATNWTAISMFGAFVVGTMFITKWAASKTKSAADFYTAGGGITGFQNGLAIAGDYMSAASFLGISAAVMMNGYDGLIYSIGFLVGWPVITFLMAEKLRNLGKFTFADVAAYRFQQTPIRAFAASGTLVVVAFYLIAQMVGAGQLIKLLFGLEYWMAVVIVGALMMVYVLFGGMTATTWVQIIKAVLLLSGATFMSFMVLMSYGFSPEALFAAAVDVKRGVAESAGKSPEEAGALAQAIMGPGSFIKDPISAISFGMALMFGTAGLPHILMRFYTVPNAKAARVSVMWATIWIGFFYLITFILGFGAMVLVGQQNILGAGGGGNMAAPMLAQVIAGDVFFGFICAVAFATILAVVAGLTLAGAGALSHDLWVNVIRGGHAPQHEQMVAARVSSIILAVCAILLGIVFEGQNVAYMVGLTFSIAASANFPALVMSVFWKRFTTWGAVTSILFGTIATLVLIYCGPTIQLDLLGPKAPPAGSPADVVAAYQASVAAIKDQWFYFPLKNPCLYTMTGAFLIGIIVSLLAPERSAQEGFAEVERRAVLGEPRGAAAE